MIDTIGIAYTLGRHSLMTHDPRQGFMQDKSIASHVTHVLVDTWMLTLKWTTNTHVTPFSLTFKA